MSQLLQPPATVILDHTSMFDFAGILAQSLRTPVVDMSGLTGAFKIKLDLSRYVGGGARDSDGLSGEGAMFFAAVSDQLGLKLERRKAPVDVLVVEHAEKPTEN